MQVRGKRWVALVALVAFSPACSSEEGGTADGRDAAAAGGGAGTGAAAGAGGLYGINGATNQLYTINPTTGAATAVVAITGVSLLNSVGVELHPGNGVLYACTDDAVLYSINPTTGVATAIGTGMGHTPPCNNLAAPWVKVACLDAL
ncbi:MAG TPA: DUF4394 domain-containing protein [Polyangiaceae bacterium]|nr:DUF4394 domain-containing protein [Polyangiaceae bacterium]HMR75567.1 DUF4394 domain-containing protein [Polyangiaceae bacterium]